MLIYSWQFRSVFLKIESSQPYKLMSTHWPTRRHRLQLPPLLQDWYRTTNTKLGKSIYEKAVIPFGIIFHGSINKVKKFQDNIHQQVIEFDWGLGNGNVINMPDVNGVTQDVTNKYGCLTTKEIRAQAAG